MPWSFSWGEQAGSVPFGHAVGWWGSERGRGVNGRGRGKQRLELAGGITSCRRGEERVREGVAHRLQLAGRIMAFEMEEGDPGDVGGMVGKGWLWLEG